MWIHLCHFRQTRNINMTIWKNNFSLFHIHHASRRSAFKTAFNFPVLLLPKVNHVKYIVRYSTNIRRVPATTEIKKLLVVAKSERLKLTGNVSQLVILAVYIMF